MLGLIVHVLSTAGASGPSSSLVIWNFDSAMTNSLGGLYNSFAKSPSAARIYLDPGVHRPASGHSLRVTVHREAQGFCGVWFGFYPGAETPTHIFTAASYEYLRFWIRGADRGAHVDFSLKLVDAAHARRDESLPALKIAPYLPPQLDREWQEVRIPLSAFKGIDPGQLVRLVLVFESPGDYRFYLDSVGFQVARATPEAASKPEPEPGAATAMGRGMWVWEAPPIIANEAKEDEFLAFCSRNGITAVYLALDSDSTPDAPRLQISTPGRYQAFLTRAHSKRLRVEALTGTPEWAAEKYHARALEAVDAVLDFNRRVPPAARFDGIHLDIEPYVLVGFADPDYRRQLLGEFLGLIARCQARIHTQPGLGLTCDVPWWFYPAGPPDRERLSVTFEGELKTVGEHLADLLDTVTLMDYRNQAAGAGGIVASGAPALAYAAGLGKHVVIGLETFQQAGEPVYFAVRLPAAEFHQRLGNAGLLGERSFHGYVMEAVADSDEVDLGLGRPTPPGLQPSESVETALGSLSNLLGAATVQGHFAIRPGDSSAVPQALADDPELENLRPFKLTDAATHLELAGYQADSRMAPNVTFHGLGRTVFDEEAHSAAEWLSQYPSFQGLAIHSYEGFLALGR